MTTELKQAAQRALLALRNSQPHPSNPFIGLTDNDFIDHEETISQLRAAIQQAEAQQVKNTTATSYLCIGVCITDGVLHATVMQHDSNGTITVVATAEIDVASLHGRDCIVKMKPATGELAEVTDSMIREAFLANGFTIKDGHSDLKPYVYAAAHPAPHSN